MLVVRGNSHSMHSYIDLTPSYPTHQCHCTSSWQHVSGIIGDGEWVPRFLCLLKEPVNTFNQSAHHAHKFCTHAGDVQTTPIPLAFDDLMRWMAVEFMCNACGSRQLPFHAFVQRPHSKLSNPPKPLYIIMTTCERYHWWWRVGTTIFKPIKRTCQYFQPVCTPCT